MYYEKIKINVPDSLKTSLENDAQRFSLVKSDGRANLNALMSLIILNHHDEFKRNQKRIQEKAYEAISKNATIPDELANKITDRILREISLSSNTGRTESCNASIALKPTTQTIGTIRQIEENLLRYRTESEYFRSLLQDYDAKSISEKETIIFKKQCEAIRAAISEKKKIFLTYVSRKDELRSKTVSPYALETSREEMHEYLLSAEGTSGIATNRLSRLSHIEILDERAEISDAQKSCLDKMIKYGAAFPITPEDGEIVVKLTDFGLEMWDRYYVHRPIPFKTEGYLFHFECSSMQVMTYFARFGKNAKILSPNSLRKRMRRFHKDAWEEYR